MALNKTGLWTALQDWPVIAIHATVTQDGKVLTFGTDLKDAQGAMMFHDLWDPVTNTHQTLNHHMDTATDIFCAASAIIPGTNLVMIAGGDARGAGGTVNFGVSDVNVLDITTGMIMPATEGHMAAARWYPTLLSLPSGQMLAISGIDGNGKVVNTPEVFTPGQGWRPLPGATDYDLSINGSYAYPKAFVASDGYVYYFANGTGPDGRQQLYQLDTKGDGALKEVVANMPFIMHSTSPAVMFDQNKVLVNDQGTGLWVMDMSNPPPTFTKVGVMSQERNYATMTVMADGKVLITGGSGNANLEAYADKTATIWDPKTKTLTDTVDEAHARLYHSTALLLQDGSILSSGGGAAGMAEHNYSDAQIYKPGYLFNADGTEAARPVVSNAPKTLHAGDVFTINVSDSATIKDLTFVRNGSATHNFDPETRALHLEFVKVDATTIAVKVPDNINVATPGSWMLFAWNDQGTPAIAPIIAIEPDHALGLSAYVPDGQNLIVNSDFMGNVLATATQTFTNDKVKGWHNSSENAIEIVKVGTKQGVDLDARTVVDETYQNVQTEAGKVYNLSLDILKATAGTSAFDILWNGQLVKSVDPTGPGSLALQVTGTGNLDKLSFREHADQNNGTGANISNVKLLFSGAMSADYKSQSLLLNGDLMANQFANTSYARFTNGQVPGWQNLSDTTVEIIKVNGKQALDLDVFGKVDEIYQDVSTQDGRVYDLRLDVVQVVAGTSDFDVLWNGKIIKTYVGDKTGSIAIQVTGTGGMDRLSFREHADQNNAGAGAKITNITLVPTDKLVPDAPIDHIVNGDFMANQFTNISYSTFTNTQVPGWKNASENAVEIFKVAGKQAIDLDVHAATDAIYQDVQTTAGKVYNLKLDVLDAPKGTSAFDVLWNGVVIKTYDGDVTGSLSLLVKGTGGLDRLTFREHADQNNGNGAKIGNVKLLDADLVTGTGTIGHGGNHIMGTDQGDWLSGTDGADHINGGAGWDTIYGGKGDDYIDGGDIAVGSGDYNQVNYDGKATDYTFARNADGTIAVSNPTYGNDTLKNIQGVYFAGEGKWYALGDLLPAIGNQSFVGSDHNDRMYGTSGNDTFLGGAGQDTFTGGKGNDVYDGGDNFDTVDLLGVASDYTVTRNADGTLTVVSKIEGTDTFKSIEGVYFHGDGSWKSIDDFAGITQPPVQGQTLTGTAKGDWITGTDGNDTINAQGGWDVIYGGKGNDVIDGGVHAAGSRDYDQVNYDGKASEYTFTSNADGTISVSHPTYGTDTLKNIQGLWFVGESKWYALGDLVPATGNQTFTASAQGDRLFGTAGNDTFIGGAGDDTFYGGKGNDTYKGGAGFNQVDYSGAASEYHVTKNADGTYTVSHATEGVDVLKDIQGLYFWGDSSWHPIDELANMPH